MHYSRKNAFKYMLLFAFITAFFLYFMDYILLFIIGTASIMIIVAGGIFAVQEAAIALKGVFSKIISRKS